MVIANAPTFERAITQGLSDSQREIWFAAQMGDAASAAFNQSNVLELKGDLDHRALSDALDGVVARHDALRTSFSAAGDEQRVHADLPLYCPVLDLSGYAGAEQNERVQSRLRGEVQTPFDLTKGPMIRAALIRLAPQKHLLVITVHHLICDGTSLNLLVEELAEEYSARAATGNGPAKPLPMQFSEFVAHQLKLGTRRDEVEKYWAQQFESPAPFLELPLDHPRPKKRTFQGGGGFLKLDPATAAEFRRMAGKHRCTLFAASLAAFYVLLHRLSGQTDLVVGVPMSARSSEGSHDVIGHCVNFLPLRISLAGNPTFSEHLTNVRNMLLDALDHVDYNFGRLIQKLKLPRHPTRAPLISTMFNVDHIQKAFKLDGVEVEVTPNPHCLTNFDFSLSLEDHQGRLEARCLYAADTIEGSTIARWLEDFEGLLRSVAANPEQRVGCEARVGEMEVLEAMSDGEAGTDAQQSEVQDQLTEIWREVMCLDSVAPTDDFFELGGHSLLVTQIIGRVRTAFGVQLSLRDFFEAPTVAELTRVIEDRILSEVAEMPESHAERLATEVLAAR